MKRLLATLALTLIIHAGALAQVAGGPISGGGGTAGIGGSTGATDDKLLCSDGAGGATLGVCTVGDIDNLRFDGNTISTTNTNGDLTLAPSGTGTIIVPVGAVSTPSIGIDNAQNTGFVFDEGGQRGVSWADSGQSKFWIGTADVRMKSGYNLGWHSATDAATTVNDTGLARSAAGVVKVTDGSTGIRGLLGGGTTVASATALPVPTGRVFHVSGTTTITSITSTNFQSGVCTVLIFDGVLTFTDGSNLKLAGDFVTTADDTISLCYDGTNWYETSRSVI